MGCGKSKVKKLTDEVKIIESGHHNGHLDGIPNPANQEVVNSVTASLNSPARASLDDSPSAEDLNDPGKRAKLLFQILLTISFLRHWPHLRPKQATPLLTASHRI